MWYIWLAIIIVLFLIIVYRRNNKKMPAGIQIFDANGKIEVDVSNRLTQVIGVRRLDTIQGEIHVNTDGNRKVFFFVSKGYFAYPPAEMISCKGSTIKWDFSKWSTLTNQYEIVYGVV